MSDRGATARRRRSRRSAQPAGSRLRRILVAIATVTLVITPISWLLLHEPQSDQADASVPYVTRPDDTYITASNEPVASRTDPPSVAPSTPGRTPTATPSGTPTPSAPGSPTPSASATGTPTAGSTHTPGATPSSEPTRTGSTSGPRETAQPTKTPNAPPPPPADNGSMTGDEAALFSMIDDARTSNGCASLGRNSNLTGGARQEAADRASSGKVSDTGSSSAATGGDDMSAQAAFNRLKSQSSSTILNCGLSELGVGRASESYCSAKLVICLKYSTRVSWVADFN